MKKNLILVAFSALFVLTSSCGSSKPSAKDNYYNNPRPTVSSDDSPYGTKQQLTSSEEYALGAPGKRSAGTGASAMESAANQLAELDARRGFSDALSAAITAAAKSAGFDITQYAGGNDDGQVAVDNGQRQNTLAFSVSRNVIASAPVVKKDKFYNAKTRRFTIFVCLEYNGEVADIAKEATKQVKQRVSDEDRTKIDFNLEKFENEVANNLIKNMQE